jgi:hypothetical protein
MAIMLRTVQTENLLQQGKICHDLYAGLDVSLNSKSLTLAPQVPYLSSQLSNIWFRQAFVQFQYISQASSIHVLHDNGDGAIVKERLMVLDHMCMAGSVKSS